MKNILVVDDSRIMRNIVKNTFDTMGIPCEYFEAENGKEALRVLNSTHIDLVFLDWNMPQLSGLDFLKEVRVTPKYEKLPVVMVTSEAARYNVIEALKSGVSAYLIKPVSVEKFTKTLSSIEF